MVRKITRIKILNTSTSLKKWMAPANTKTNRTTHQPQGFILFRENYGYEPGKVLVTKRSAWQDLGMHITSIPFKLDHSLHDKERGIHKNEGFTPCPWSVTKHKTSWVKSVLLRHAQTFRRLFLFCNEMTMLPCEVQWNSISRAFLYQIKMFQCWTNTSPIGRLILSKVRDYLPAILTSHFGEKIICQKPTLELAPFVHKKSPNV